MSKPLDRDNLGHGYLHALIAKINTESEKCTIGNFHVVQRTWRHWQEGLIQLEVEKRKALY